MQIRALWIDDQPNNSFIDRAAEYINEHHKDGIYIEVFENVDAGIEELLSHPKKYEAIILDANCISHNDGSKDPEISALGYALRKITENNILTPWFVYSAGGFTGEESIDITVKPYEREYDDRYWYKKPAEMSKLFDKIIEVVKNSDLYKLKQKYPEIFSWYPNQEELIDILSFLENKKSNNPDVFNKIRKELDWIMEYLYKCGYLQKPYEGSNLGECSAFLGRNELKDFVPLHIQRSIHSTTAICNEGSHRLAMDELVKQNKAPYLVHSTIIEYLNILYWAKDISTDEIEVLKKSQDIKDAINEADKKRKNYNK